MRKSSACSRRLRAILTATRFLVPATSARRAARVFSTNHAAADSTNIRATITQNRAEPTKKAPEGDSEGMRVLMKRTSEPTSRTSLRCTPDISTPEVLSAPEEAPLTTFTERGPLRSVT